MYYLYIALSRNQHLPHWGRDKMAANFADEIFKFFFIEWKFFVLLVKYDWNLVLRVNIDAADGTK